MVVWRVYDLEHPTDPITRRVRFSCYLEAMAFNLLTCAVNSQVHAMYTCSVSGFSCMITVSL